MAIVPSSARPDFSHPATRAAFDYFTIRSDDFDTLVRLNRPIPPSPDARAAAIARLPREGELTPDVHQAAKLASIRAVLAFHDREQTVEIRLIAVGRRARIGFYARTVLLVSSDAIELLTADELQAVIAHELAHDYIWKEYEDASALTDTALLQELELRCDGLAVITLHRLGVDSKHLISGLTKLTRYNERAGAMINAANYVPLSERRQFIRAMASLVIRAAAAQKAGGR